MASEPISSETAFTQLVPEILGTKVGDLIAPCSEHRSAPAPPPPDHGAAIALALSGGGTRATLAGLGVLRFLADAGLLGNVRYVSSVSGGGIANAMFAHTYSSLSSRNFDTQAFVELVQAPIVRRVSTQSLTKKMILGAWRIIGPKTRTQLLADSFDDWFFEREPLHGLAPPCRFIFNSANLTTGVRFGFEREFTGDYVMGTVPTESLRLRLADAVAASAAVPGLLAPYIVKGAFPCGDRFPAARLVDGGAYENTGLEPIDRLPDDFVIAMNAGGIFRTGPFGGIPIIRDLQRSEGLLYRQSTGLRMRDMVGRFRLREQAVQRGEPPSAEARWGVLFGLATTLEPGPSWMAPPLPAQRRIQLAQLKTSFARFEPQDCRDLIYHAWWLTGANISRYHPDLIAEPWPQWEE
jgi:NTE family protein